MTRELNQLTKKLTEKKTFDKRKLNFPFDLSKLHHHWKSAQMTVNSTRGGNELRTSEANEVETERGKLLSIISFPSSSIFLLILTFLAVIHFLSSFYFPSSRSRMKIEA